MSWEAALATFAETLNILTDEVNTGKQSLDDALFALQAWMERNAQFMTAEERVMFSGKLHDEKEAPTQDGEAQSNDSSLVASVMRLHAMRLLYRFDEKTQPAQATTDDSPYQRAIDRFRAAMREAELGMNEARVDAAIANAHQILQNTSANRRWLQDALAHLQQVAQKDLIKLAEAVPAPETPPLNLLQRTGFRLFGIKPEEIVRRNLVSVRQLAQLQTSQLIEMIRLLAENFEVLEDHVGAKQALILMTRLQDR